MFILFVSLNKPAKVLVPIIYLKFSFPKKPTSSEYGEQPIKIDGLVSTPILFFSIKTVPSKNNYSNLCEAI